MKTRLSSYGEASVEPAPINRLMAEFAHDFRDGVDINLGVGYVNESTIPTALLTEAMQAVVAEPKRYRQAFNYGGSEGSPNLIASLRRLIGPPAEGRRIAIGACGATSVLGALAAVLPQGIIVTTDPSYYIYTDALERYGFEILAIPEDSEGPDPVVLEHKLEEMGLAAARLSFFYFVTVNNPSGTILTNRRRRQLYEVAARLSRQQKRLIPIIYDLAYELLLHDPAVEPFQSVLPEDELGIVYEVGTLSKILAPAMRIGYILGPDSPLMRALIQHTTDTGLSASLFVQEMASYFLDHHLTQQLATVNQGYRQKALSAGEAIRSRLGEHLENLCGGSAGFYFYLTLSDVETHPQSDFFAALAHESPRVIYIPGTYCVHPRGELAPKGRRQLRISYGFEDVPNIVRAIDHMRAAIETKVPV